MQKFSAKTLSVRQQRASEVLRDSVAKLFTRNPFHDPLLAGQRLTIVHIDITPDLKNAKIYLDGRTLQQPKEVLAALKRSNGYIKKHLAGDVEMRALPRISFVVDNSSNQHERIDEILIQLKDNA